MVYTTDQIRAIATPIAAAYDIKSMSLFGSYARGEATEDSDVDILIERARSEPLFRWAACTPISRKGWERSSIW